MVGRFLADGQGLSRSQREAGGVVHLLDLGLGHIKFTGVGDSGMVGQGEISGSLRVVDKEEDAVHADLLMRYPPVAISTDTPCLTREVGIDGLEGGWKGIINGEVA